MCAHVCANRCVRKVWQQMCAPTCGMWQVQSCVTCVYTEHVSVNLSSVSEYASAAGAGPRRCTQVPPPRATARCVCVHVCEHVREAGCTSERVGVEA
jgi:hypothetical protein